MEFIKLFWRAWPILNLFDSDLKNNSVSKITLSSCMQIEDYIISYPNCFWICYMLGGIRYQSKWPLNKIYSQCTLLALVDETSHLCRLILKLHQILNICDAREYQCLLTMEGIDAKCCCIYFMWCSSVCRISVIPKFLKQYLDYILNPLSYWCDCQSIFKLSICLFRGVS